MYLWRRRATPQWWSENEEQLRKRAGMKLVVVERPDRKRLQIEVVSESRQELCKLTWEFGGGLEKLPRDWLKRFIGEQRTKQLKIGSRLIIYVGGTSASRLRARAAESQRQGRSHISILAGTAFGTGQHPTTMMCLRMLERALALWGAHAPRVRFSASSPKSSSKVRDGESAIARTRGRMRSPEVIVDVGTGSGILAVAATRLGAKRVIALDDDPVAISTAKQNARLNKIDTVDFRIADVRSWKPPRQIDIVCANLFSELLVEILPTLRRAAWLILSGILREQESDLTRALNRQKIDIVQVRRRGKWVAILARSLGTETFSLCAQRELHTAERKRSCKLVG